MKDEVEVAEIVTRKLWKGCPFRRRFDFDELKSVVWIGVHRGFELYVPGRKSQQNFGYLCGYRDGLTWMRDQFTKYIDNYPEQLLVVSPTGEEDEHIGRSDPRYAELLIDDELRQFNQRVRGMLTMRMEGHKLREIGDAFGVSRQRVCALIREAGRKLCVN